MSTLDWVALAAVVLVALAWYLSYNAARLDRLHGRVEATYAALDAQLVRRAEASLELANSGLLDPASALVLASAAADSLAHADDPDDRERAAVESDVTEALTAVLTPEVVATLRSADGVPHDGLERIVRAGERVQLARRFHNDAVNDVRRVRRKGAVRGFRLAGHAELPESIDFDDELPTGLRG
ncbi:hypothetical protein [Lapillicoccus jejuensis]|uniref:LemA family protein n=1 Tax=Lapillicoccus jejuensis TaxID=402171 RepID=A0A542E552_9MICO|nr:hypothetical protein [Lapillicoccus jejuensis]TQJ10473.1 hypothetical protein FB458_3596 [Lapillicoccus jejuensis]